MAWISCVWRPCGRGGVWHTRMHALSPSAHKLDMCALHPATPQMAPFLSIKEFNPVTITFVSSLAPRRVEEVRASQKTEGKENKTEPEVKGEPVVSKKDLEKE